MIDMIDADSHSRMIEFCCPVCLRSARGPDTARRPRCPSCGIRMEPDDLTIPPSLTPHQAPRPLVTRRKARE
jgi:hypothetical protein